MLKYTFLWNCVTSVNLERVDNPFDSDGIYWRLEGSTRGGSPQNITAVLQENGDLAIKYDINGYDYTFTLQLYNNPNDPNVNYW